MAEAILKIRPVLSGNVNTSLGSLTRATQSLGSSQSRSLGKATRAASKLERGYYAAGRGANSLIKSTAGIARSMLSIKSLVGGIMLGTAGKTFFDMTIGSASSVKQSSKLLKAVIKDQDKFLKGEKAARDLVKDVSSLDYSSALGGLEKTYVLAGGNVDKAKDLVKVAKALEQLDPSQGFEGALFALKELETGDTMSLKSRFGIKLPTRAEAAKMAKKGGKTLNDFYFGKLTDFIDNRFGSDTESGVDTLLRIDREGLPGRVKMIKTSFADLFRSIGTEAENVATNEMLTMKASLDALQADPQFKNDVKDLTKSFAEATRWAFKLAVKLPAGLKSARNFAKEYSTELKLVAGFLIANKLTGGGAGRLAGAGARGVIGKAAGFLGKKVGLKGVAGAGLAGMTATPVYVVNMGSGIGGSGDSFLDRNTGKAAGAISFSKLGAVGTGTAVAGGALILGSAALGAATFYKAVNDTNRVVKKYEQRAKEAAERSKKYEEIRKKGVESDLLADKLESPHARKKRLLEKESKSLSTLAGLGQTDKLRAGINNAFGGGHLEFKGSPEQKNILSTLNRSLAGSGQRLSLKKGQSISDARLTGGLGVFGQNDPSIRKRMIELQKDTSDAGKRKFLDAAKSLDAMDKQAKKTAAGFNKIADKVEYHFHGVVDGEDAARRAGDHMDKMMSNAFAKQAANTGS